MNKFLILIIFIGLLSNQIIAKNLRKRQLSCLACVSAVTTCAASGCGGFLACTGCVTGIAASCGSCANELCSASRSDFLNFPVVQGEPEQKLTCQISASLCDFHCRCRYSKSGYCSGGTCYCR